MKLISIIAAIYVMGMLTFYTMAAFERYEWQQYYYLWQKGVDCLVWLFIWRNVHRSFKMIFFFTLIRFLWEVHTTATGTYHNNPLAVNILFSTLLAACIGIIIKEWHILK